MWHVYILFRVLAILLNYILLSDAVCNVKRCGSAEIREGFRSLPQKVSKKYKNLDLT